MLAVTGAAGLAAVSLANHARVEATTGADTGSDFFMTIETFELRRTTAELVARRALECAAQ